MENIDSKILGELVLNSIYPIYVIDEETKNIVFTNKILQSVAGRSMIGENCYEAFFNDVKPNGYSPETGAVGERYQWEYFDQQHNALFKICNLWFENNGRKYRLGLAADASDMMGLNRSVVDYLWLMQKLSELQMKIIREQSNTIPLLLEFFMEHYKAESVAVSFVEREKEYTITLNDRGCNIGDGALNRDDFVPIRVLNGEYKLWIDNMKNRETWEEDRSFVLSVAGLYLENDMLWKKIEWENTHDKATTLFNRAFFQKNLGSEYNTFQQVGIIFADIDNLKQVNDVWGHEMGDRLIKKAADVLLDVSKEKIHSYRMGGDEFMLVCCEYTQEELEALLKDIVIRMNTSNDAIKMPQISISIGCAHSTSPYNIESLMKVADERMYEEKRQKKHGRQM